MAKDYSTFDFHYDRVVKFANSIRSADSRIEYLDWIYKEYWQHDEYLYYQRQQRSGPGFESRRRGTLETRRQLTSRVINEFPIRQLWLEIEYQNGLRGTDNLEQPKALKQNRTARSEPNVAKIRWRGSERLLLYLIDKLYQENLFDFEYDKRLKFISEHFLNSKGNPFDQHQLSVSQTQAQDNQDKRPRGSERIDEIIDGTKSANQKHHPGDR